MQQPSDPLAPTKPSSPGLRPIKAVLGGGVLAALVAVALLVPLPFHGRAASAIGDFVHAPLFGAMTLMTLAAWTRVSPLKGFQETNQAVWKVVIVRGVIVGSVWCALGLGIEILQDITGRSATRHDAIANALGIFSAICLYACYGLALQGRMRSVMLFAFLAFAGMVAAWWRPTKLLADVIAVSTEFPLLASFETSEEQTRWYLRGATARRVPLDSTDGGYSYEVQFKHQHGPAMTLVEVYPDWTPYDTLELDVSLPSSIGNQSTVDQSTVEQSTEAVELFIKIMDRVDNRDRGFLTNAKVLPGPVQRLRIPFSAFQPRTVGDTIDLSKMVYLEIGLWDAGRPVTIRFDRLICTGSGQSQSSK